MPRPACRARPDQGHDRRIIWHSRALSTYVAWRWSRMSIGSACKRSRFGRHVGNGKILSHGCKPTPLVSRREHGHRSGACRRNLQTGTRNRWSSPSCGAAPPPTGEILPISSTLILQHSSRCLRFYCYVHVAYGWHEVLVSSHCATPMANGIFTDAGSSDLSCAGRCGAPTLGQTVVGDLGDCGSWVRPFRSGPTTPPTTSCRLWAYPLIM